MDCNNENNQGIISVSGLGTVEPKVRTVPRRVPTLRAFSSARNTLTNIPGIMEKTLLKAVAGRLLTIDVNGSLG
jgi:hypothetical protein